MVHGMVYYGNNKYRWFSAYLAIVNNIVMFDWLYKVPMNYVHNNI